MKRIMHIASFKGNVGDIVNHHGFTESLREVCEEELFFEKIEIRDFYRNSKKRSFDLKFAEEINQYDVLVLGGGGFFDVRWNDSFTGTTIDMDKDFIHAINIPVIVNAMGVHNLGDERFKEASERFINFINYVKTKGNWFLSFRNDGSIKRFINQYGSDAAKGIEVVPDNGFVFREHVSIWNRKDDSITIGFNVSNDLFVHDFLSGCSEADIYEGIVDAIRYCCEKNYKVQLFVHTPQDIEMVHMIYKRLDDAYFRYNIIIAPYRPLDVEGTRQLAEYYKSCDVVVAMRFHANILGLQNEVPTVGLAGHEQISDLYEEINLQKYCIKVGEPDWKNKVLNCISEYVECSASYLKDVRCEMEKVKEQHHDYIRRLKEFLEKYMMMD